LLYVFLVWCHCNSGRNWSTFGISPPPSFQQSKCIVVVAVSAQQLPSSPKRETSIPTTTLGLNDPRLTAGGDFLNLPPSFFLSPSAASDGYDHRQQMAKCDSLCARQLFSRTDRCTFVLRGSYAPKIATQASERASSWAGGGGDYA
jgi:hypothetical protein